MAEGGGRKWRENLNGFLLVMWFFIPSNIHILSCCFLLITLASDPDVLLSCQGLHVCPVIVQGNMGFIQAR